MNNLDSNYYDLPISSQLAPSPEAIANRIRKTMSAPILLKNIHWFCRLRWGAAAFLLAFGILGKFDGLLPYLGLLPPGNWPFVISFALVFCNLAYLLHSSRMESSPRTQDLVFNLWSQIILDLLILTIVVHFLGSVHTYIPVTYLFHIVLVCVFFSSRQSLTVVIIASIMFGACVAAEEIGLIEPVKIFTSNHVISSGIPASIAYIVNFPSAIIIWLVVWYMTSHLSTMVRTREFELEESNRRITISEEERSRHMLTMTHQLKAPFAAIHANVQLMLKGYCGDLSDKAVDVATKISARARRLATEIQEMLQLANLNSRTMKPPQASVFELSEVINYCLNQVQPRAQEREITIDADLSPVIIRGVEDHLKMLLGNLLANAVLYSHKGGQVKISCRHEGQSQIEVIITDYGIGIVAEKLPLIFDEHYRTKEAVRHNNESSGLGLAIVKRVAQLHGIRLQVQSKIGEGTVFKLWFSPLMPDSGIGGETAEGE